MHSSCEHKLEWAAKQVTPAVICPKNKRYAPSQGDRRRRDEYRGESEARNLSAMFPSSRLEHSSLRLELCPESVLHSNSAHPSRTIDHEVFDQVAVLFLSMEGKRAAQHAPGPGPRLGQATGLAWPGLARPCQTPRQCSALLPAPVIHCGRTTPRSWARAAALDTQPLVTSHHELGSLPA